MVNAFVAVAAVVAVSRSPTGQAAKLITLRAFSCESSMNLVLLPCLKMKEKREKKINSRRDAVELSEAQTKSQASSKKKISKETSTCEKRRSRAKKKVVITTEKSETKPD